MATKKKNQTRKPIESVLDLTQNILMAGLGGLDLTAAEIQKVSRDLVERGEKTDATGLKAAREFVGRTREQLEDGPAIPKIDEVRDAATKSFDRVRSEAQAAEDRLTDRIKGFDWKGLDFDLNIELPSFPTTRSSFDELSQRVDDLAASIAKLSRPAPKKRTTKKATTKKATTKKTATKKTATKKAAPAPKAEPVAIPVEVAVQV